MIMASGRWLRGARLAVARLSHLRMTRAPDAPALPIRDPWSGDAALGARLLRGEIELPGAVRALKAGFWQDGTGPAAMRAHAHGFTWLRDLRALGTDAARLRARALVGDWIANPPTDLLAHRPDIVGARIAAWLGHYDFFFAAADDLFRQRVMARLLADARWLATSMPAEEMDGRALTALKGLIAAAAAMPDHAAYMSRALRFLGHELARQVLPDGCHAERSPGAHLAALRDLVEIRALLQGAQVGAPAELAGAIVRMAPVLRLFRHGDGGLALFNNSREESATLIEQVLAQAGRTNAAPTALAEGGFQRLQAGRTVLIVDCGVPAARGVDRFAHAGTLGMEISVGRQRLIVNCGAAPAASREWIDALRATAAHSTLVIADTSSSELHPEGLGRRPLKVTAQRQEDNGALWLDASHDGWKKSFGALHHRRLWLAQSGDEIRGEDVVEAATGQPYALRFHLHPTVQASLQQDGEAVLLRLPSGSGWRLRAQATRLSLEESIYMGGTEPRRSEQVVLSGYADEPQMVKWAITKLA